MDTSSVGVELIVDGDRNGLLGWLGHDKAYRSQTRCDTTGREATYIAPTSLQPWSWIDSIEDFCVREVHTIGVDPGFIHVQDVVASGASWHYLFVIRSDVILGPSLLVLQPATSIIEGRAACPPDHLRVVTSEVRTRPRYSACRRLEDRASGIFRD